MSLTFGTHQVQDNEILTPIITREKLEFTTPLVLPNYVTLLLNTTTNIPYWFFISYYDRAKEIIPYHPPIDPGRYTFLGYDTRGVRLPLEIMERDFMQYHKNKEFGKQVFRIGFNVQAGSLASHFDISRLIASNLSVTEIEDICDSDPVLDQTVCNNLGFWQQLALKRLTSNLSLIGNNIDDIKNELIHAEDRLRLSKDILTEIQLLNSLYDKNTFDNLYRYDIAFMQMWNNLNSGIKLALFIVYINRNLADADLIWNILPDDMKVYGILNMTNSLTQRNVLEHFLQKLNPSNYKDLISGIYENKKFYLQQGIGLAQEYLFILNYISDKLPTQYPKNLLIQQYDAVTA
jgi:hypothetical protein